MNRLATRLLTDRPILIQLGVVLILCQLIAQAITAGLMIWRYERPELLAANTPTTVQAIGFADVLRHASEAEREAIKSALQRSQNDFQVLENRALSPASPESVAADKVLRALAFSAPNEARQATLVLNPNGLGGTRIAFAIDEGTALVFPSDHNSDKLTIPKVVSALLLTMIIVSVGILSFWALRALTAPLRLFAENAERFSVDLDPTPLPERGPRELRALAQVFNRMKTKLRHLVESRSRMLAAVSHDLRTPLTRIRLRAEALPDGEDKERILRDVATMNEMIGQALSYLRDQASSARPERVDLAALLASICDEFSDTGRPATFSGPRNVVLECEPDLLTRAISNLVDNAAKFGGKAEVRLETPSPSEIVVLVEDEGPGIPDAAKTLAFEPFSRGDVSRGSPETEGFGLGLAIARQIVERHGGAIALRDRAPKGLSVRVSLPVGRKVPSQYDAGRPQASTARAA